MVWVCLRFLLVIFGFLALAACGNTGTQPEPTTTVASSSTPSPAPTITLEPSHTPLPTNTQVPTATPSPIPTATVTPTPTPQPGETRGNPETGQKEVFSNAYGWVEAHEIGAVIEEDGVVKVMMVQGLLPLSEVASEMVASTEIDVQTTEIVVSNKFVQIGNFLLQVNSAGDSIISHKDNSRRFERGETLVKTMNGESVIMSRYNTGVEIWDTSTESWADTVPGTLAEVAPLAVSEDGVHAYDADGWKIGLFNEEFGVWVGFYEKGRELTIQRAEDFLNGSFTPDASNFFRQNGQIKGLDTFEEGDGRLFDNGYFTQNTRITPVYLGRLTNDAGLQMYGVGFGTLTDDGQIVDRKFGLVSNGFENHSQYPGLDQTPFRVVEGPEPDVSPEGVWASPRENVALNRVLDNNIGMPVRLSVNSSNVNVNNSFGGLLTPEEVEVFQGYAKFEIKDSLRVALEGNEDKVAFVTSSNPRQIIVEYSRDTTKPLPHISQVLVALPPSQE